MTRSTPAAARLLLAAIGLVGIGVQAFGRSGVQVFGCSGVQVGGNGPIGWIGGFLDARTPDGLSAPSVTPDSRVVQPHAWMDRNGNRVADTLERAYRRDRKAGLQLPGGPR